MKMVNQDFQYDINSLIAKDEAGVISSFALQLDSILSNGEQLNETGFRVLDETFKLLYEIVSSGDRNTYDTFAEGYREGYGDAENGFLPEY